MFGTSLKTGGGKKKNKFRTRRYYYYITVSYERGLTVYGRDEEGCDNKRENISLESASCYNRLRGVQRKYTLHYNNIIYYANSLYYNTVYF